MIFNQYYGKKKFKCSLFRERKKARDEKVELLNNIEVEGLGFDGKKSNVRIKNNNGGTTLEKFENITLLEFPNNKYLGFTSLKIATAKNIADSIIEYLKER